MFKHFWKNLATCWMRCRGGRRCARMGELIALVVLLALSPGRQASALDAPPRRQASLTSQTADASLKNAGFESQNLINWTASPSDLVTVVDAHLAGNNITVYEPVEGGWYALLEPEEEDVYTTLSQNFNAQTGDVLSCRTFFDGEDSEAYNDTADVRILSGTDLVATVYHEDMHSAADDGSLPWEQWSYTLTGAGSYTLEARIANVGDAAMPSYLGLDGCSITQGAQGRAAFNAYSAAGRVLLTWQMPGETDTVGYNLYRTLAADGEYDQLNPTPIASSSYSYEDYPGAGIFFYRLETIANAGNSEQGPVQVQSTSPFRRPPHQPVPPP